MLESAEPLTQNFTKFRPVSRPDGTASRQASIVHAAAGPRAACAVRRSVTLIEPAPTTAHRRRCTTLAEPAYFYCLAIE